ncbi:MAG: PEGA domain-containing protein [Myxococcales bacterium]|nr:PEGA domain-containing protein [Myxococcales bacterium]
MPGRKKTGLAKLFSPKGVTALGILALLGVAAFLVKPFFTKQDPAAANLTLVVKAVPANATVTLDGAERAKTTPARIEGLVPGTQHNLRVEVSGFTPYEETFTVPVESQDGELRKSVFLRKAMGVLLLKTEPPGAEIYMDGKYIGDTPLTKKQLDRDKNEIVLLIRKDGFQDRREVLTWGEQTTLEHTVQLKANK